MRHAALWISLLLALPGRAGEAIPVATFSTVLTELAREIGGEHVAVTGLIQPDTDPHEYQPTPGDLSVAGQARLILTAGKQLDGFVGKLPPATGARLVRVGDEIAGDDPHWWHSVALMKKAAAIVCDALIAVDPKDAADFRKNLDGYLGELRALDAWVKRKVAELPRDRRQLVTSHDAFQYFARDYGFTILAVEGVSTEAEPSNRHVAELIDEVKRTGVKAVFLESTLNPKVTREITRETGAKIGGVLYADGLGAGEAGTYAGMMKHNVSTIVDALK